MRLIDAEALIYDDEPLMVEFVDETRFPKYAILSHMWAEEEVLYQDFALGPQHEFDVSRDHARPSRTVLRRHGTQSSRALQRDETEEDSASSYSSVVTDGDSDLEGDLYTMPTVSASPKDEPPFLSSDTISSARQRSKRGWKKVLNACLQACRDSFQYVWIDTCCIDKSSSAELSEAINSMYRWYSLAGICYAYLGDCLGCPSMSKPGQFMTRARTRTLDRILSSMDISERFSRLERHAPGLLNSPALGHWRRKTHFFRHDGTDRFLLERLEPIVFQETRLDKCTLTSLRKSRWFLRGWCLQELIAPPEVVFFDKEWRKIGQKTKLIRVLNSISGIHYPALYGDIDGLSAAQKMSWAVKRQTTRVEDEAYCLLGLFDINMPLLYGEGKKAFRRLQEEILQTSSDASIFAWEVGPKAYDQKHSLFATSPADFWWRADSIHTNRIVKRDSQMQLTNEGLRTTMFLLPWPQQHRSAVSIGLLACQLDDNSWIGIRLVYVENDPAKTQSHRDMQTSVTAEPSSTILDSALLHRRLVVIPRYELRGGPSQLLIGLTADPHENDHFIPLWIPNITTDPHRIAVRMPDREAGISLQVIAAYPSFLWNHSEGKMALPTCCVRNVGAIAIQDQVSGSTFSILISLTDVPRYEAKDNFIVEFILRGDDVLDFPDNVCTMVEQKLQRLCEYSVDRAHAAKFEKDWVPSTTSLRLSGERWLRAELVGHAAEWVPGGPVLPEHLVELQLDFVNDDHSLSIVTQDAHERRSSAPSTAA